jgi:TPR repeat protein
LLIEFVERFAAHVLLAAPAAAAAWQLYRTRRHVTDYERYQIAAQAFDRHNFPEALRHLEPLASKNYPRALYLLGRLRASAPGAWRDEPAAVELYRRAAERGHAEAQYALGTMCADGRGTGKDALKAAQWYERAAAAGLPEAAMSLAYLSENGVGTRADRERAIEWYHRAAAGFLKARRREEALAAIRALEALASAYPAVLDLVATLRVSAATMKG